VLPGARYPEATDEKLFARRALEALRALPGVEKASLTGTIPFGDSYSDAVIFAEGYQMKPGESLVSPNRLVAAAGYFETMGIPLVAGRFFNDGDTAEAMRAVIVDESLAKKFWPGQSPIGKRMYRPRSAEDLYGTGPDTKWLTVVGVVGDIKLRDLLDAERRVGSYYFPFDQHSENVIGFVVKTSREPMDLAESVRRAIAAIDPELPLFDVTPLSQRISDSLVGQRSPMLLSVVFAGVALFLAVVGLYGVLAYLVTQRSREIGIRMAVGGAPWRIVRLVVEEGLAILALGLAAGLALVVMLRGVLKGYLYGVGPLDPLALAGMAVVLSLAALAACSLPALRAARIHPAIVLHE
jgi:predicted permease